MGISTNAICWTLEKSLSGLWIDRRPNPHLAFGLGQHHCIGAHLARREMRALLKTLLPRLESVELAAPPRRTCSIMVSGISSLSIRCTWRPLGL